ncbi:hypothetical protein Hanom_Chr06g00524641 [Helianthus anomalus]
MLFQRHTIINDNRWGWGAGEWSEFEVKLVCEDLRAAMIYAWVCNTYRSRPHVLCLKFTSMWMLCRFTKSKNHKWFQT